MLTNGRRRTDPWYRKMRIMLDMEFQGAQQSRTNRWLHRNRWLPDVWEEEPLTLDSADVIEARELLELNGGVITTYGFRAYPLRQRFENIGSDPSYFNYYGTHLTRYRL